MAKWQHKIQIKQFLSEKEDYRTCKEFIFNVYQVLKNDRYLKNWEWIGDFEKFPEEDSELWGSEEPVEYVNNLLDLLYDYCDENRIWVE